MDGQAKLDQLPRRLLAMAIRVALLYPGRTLPGPADA